MGTPDAKKLRRLGRRMLRYLDDTVDPAVRRATAGHTVSCKPGCAGCCYLLAMATLPEALGIADWLLAEPSRRARIPALLEVLRKQAESVPPEPGPAARARHFERAIPCVFLDLPSKRCTIYPVRPASCRHHLVVSDPALCQPEAGVQEVVQLDSFKADVLVAQAAAELLVAARLPLTAGPLAHQMVRAFELLGLGAAPAQGLARRAL